MKEIQVESGIAIVDDEDYDKVSQYNWLLHEKGYAVANHKGKKLRMHRVIMGATDPDDLVDHRDRDKLNNRKLNLRMTDRSGNACNRHPNHARDNAFKGVYPNAGKFEARIKIHGKPKYLGRFKTAEEAAVAYNNAAKELHGDMAFLNVL